MGAAKRAPMSPYAHFSHQRETTNVRAHFPLCPTDRKLCKVRWSGRGSLGTDPVSGAATSRGAEKVSLFPWAAVPDTPNVPWAYSPPFPARCARQESGGTAEGAGNHEVG